MPRQTLRVSTPSDDTFIQKKRAWRKPRHASNFTSWDRGQALLYYLYDSMHCNLSFPIFLSRENIKKLLLQRTQSSLDRNLSMQNFDYWTIDGYVAVPHELLHVAAYKLLGKKFSYRFGDNVVKGLERESRRERLFVLLFPLFVTSSLGLLFSAAWVVTTIQFRFPTAPLDYHRVAPLWHQSLFFIGVVAMFYAFSCMADLYKAYRLLGKATNDPPQKCYEQ